MKQPQEEQHGYVPVPEAMQTRLAFLGGTKNAVAGETEQ
jgi:hypothetical protein